MAQLIAGGEQTGYAVRTVIQDTAERVRVTGVAYAQRGFVCLYGGRQDERVYPYCRNGHILHWWQFFDVYGIAEIYLGYMHGIVIVKRERQY